MIAVGELVMRVRRLLNEAEEDVHLSLLSEDTRSIGRHIVRLLPQAVALAQKNKAPNAGNVNPRSMDDSGVFISDCGDGTGQLTLPENFAALISLRLKGWKRPCKKVLAADCSEALSRQSMHVRAGVCRPVCVESVTADGSRAVLLSPLPAVSQLEHFVYEATFNADEGLVGCDPVLADAVAYYCAALVYSVFERQDQANAFLSLATLLCNGKSVERR